ncbi:hypothetical protein CsSME_00008698 [Camellia sinensis var. sinensis]
MINILCAPPLLPVLSSRLRKVEERTRRKGTKEKGKSRSTSLYYHKGCS